MSRCTVESSILADQTIAAQYCNGVTDICLAICANPDISGIGVRASFYAQSVIGASLVILSPKDSVPAAWAGTLLTTALIIAAIIQKTTQDLSLHHATLIMNFATLSCISSLATAPKLPIWRLRTNEYLACKLASHGFEPENLAFFSQHVGSFVTTQFSSQTRHGVKIAQIRERLVLVLSLSAQVILQWTWGIILFLSPSYNQPACSEQTQLVLFLKSLSVGVIDADTRGAFAVWPMYLLCSLTATLVLWIRLVLSCSKRAHHVVPLSTATSVAPSARTSFVIELGEINGAPTAPERSQTVRWTWPGRIRKTAQKYVSLVRGQPPVFWVDVFWFVLWLLYIIASEMQIDSNCIFSGENQIESFGQITAVLLISSSLWSLVVAIYRYPKLMRKQARQRGSGLYWGEHRELG